MMTTHAQCYYFTVQTGVERLRTSHGFRSWLTSWTVNIAQISLRLMLKRQNDGVLTMRIRILNLSDDSDVQQPDWMGLLQPNPDYVDSVSDFVFDDGVQLSSRPWPQIYRKTSLTASCSWRHLGSPRRRFLSHEQGTEVCIQPYHVDSNPIPRQPKFCWIASFGSVRYGRIWQELSCQMLGPCD